jgi:hypothetical protein
VTGSEQNPQVPLASEDAFAQVPGNAETAVGLFSSALTIQHFNTSTSFYEKRPIW